MIGHRANLKPTSTTIPPPNAFTTKGLPDTPQHQSILRTSRARNPSPQAGLRTLRSGVPATRGPLTPLGYPNVINSFLTLVLLVTPNLPPRGSHSDNRTHTSTRRDITPYAKTVPRRERFRLAPDVKVGNTGRTMVDDGGRGFTWNLGTW